MCACLNGTIGDPKVACIQNITSDVEAYGKPVYKDNGVWMLCPKGQNVCAWIRLFKICVHISI